MSSKPKTCVLQKYIFAAASKNPFSKYLTIDAIQLKPINFNIYIYIYA